MSIKAGQDRLRPGGFMFPFVRTRRFAFAAVGVGAFGSIVLLAAHVFINNINKGDPDPQADSTIAVCSDVPIHAWYTVNIGTETRPDNKKVDDGLEATGHGLDPFDED